MVLIPRLFLLLLGLVVSIVSAWTTSSSLIASKTRTISFTRLSQAATALTNDSAKEEEEDEEFEYIEYDVLTEAEFIGSEWLVGTCMDKSSNRIDETWLRLAVDENGKNVAIWGDNSQGKWTIDPATGFFSASKENVLTGKKIWAGTADDYYYLQGTVRGWNFLSAANVLGQWQARRLGVDPEEAGVAPWFQEEIVAAADEEEGTAPALASVAVTEVEKTDTAGKEEKKVSAKEEDKKSVEEKKELVEAAADSKSESKKEESTSEKKD